MNLAPLARDLGISSDTLRRLYRRQAIVADPGVAGPDQRILERTCCVRPRGRPIASSAAGASKATGCDAEPDDPVADLHPRSGNRRPIAPSRRESRTGPHWDRGHPGSATTTKENHSGPPSPWDHGLAPAARDAFIDGKPSLPGETLGPSPRTVAASGVRPATDRLRPAVKEPPRPMGVLPNFRCHCRSIRQGHCNAARNP